MSSEKTSSSKQKPSPYDVHPSEQPGQLIVPIRLNGANYSSWSKSMVHALTAKNKIGFINGSIAQPDAEEDDSEFDLWNQCNSLLLSWLTNSVEVDIAESVIHAKTAQEVWDDLRDQFSQKNAAAIYQIQKNIATLAQGSITVAVYFTKLKSLWDELEAYRPTIVCNQMKAHRDTREEDKLMQFLMGLGDTYKNVRSNILAMNPLPNVRQAYSIVIQEETLSSSIEATSQQQDSGFTIAAAAQRYQSGQSKFKSEKVCDHCSKTGHTINECRQLKFYCPFCDRRGHTEDRCHAKNGTKNNSGKNNRRNSKANAVESQATETGTPSAFSPEQLKQLAEMFSTMNKPLGNDSAYANAAGLGYGEDDWLG